MTTAAAPIAPHVAKPADTIPPKPVRKTLTIVNQLAGVAPSFLLVLANITGVSGAVMILNKCISEKLSFATKRGDVAIPEFDFSACADDADNIGIISLPE